MLYILQELCAAEIPSAAMNGVSVKILAGESMDVKSPVFTRTPSLYLDFSLEPGSQYAQAVPAGWTAFAYILEVGMCLQGGRHSHTY